MLDDFKSESSPPPDFTLTLIDDIYLKKTVKRLNEFKELTGFDINRKLTYSGDEEQVSLLELAKLTCKFINCTSLEHISISHGDPCFSNLLYDSRTNITKVIDPRGALPNGCPSVYGDIRYDLAKVYHSFIGLYDFIIAGRYSLEKLGDTYKIEFDKDYEKNSQVFVSIFLEDKNITEIEILSITIHLFLSMLPLHEDRADRQEAFIANSLRLYKILKGKIT